MFCRHPRLSTLPKGLFDGLASFRDLEARIAPLPEELQRGDALEVFVEAYLQTHPVFQVKDLWLVGQIPTEVRKALNLPKDAKGIDGVFRTRSGTLVPYQVKFRIGRPQVGVREVSTFLGLTERAKDRLLISNSDRYADDVENRDRLRVLTGTYFDSLTGDELDTIAIWLKGRAARPAPATPRPHQQKAIADLATALATEDRATAVMACGTGKTLVGLRVAEAMRPKTVLVLVPSLALLSQALADWCRDTNWGDKFEYLCVCSDPSVSGAADEWSLRTSETPFPVQTQPAVVRNFLSRSMRGKVRVVFSTYHSAPVVAKGMQRGSAFDFAVFDEAHKTAGHRGTAFAFALADKRMRIRKRLFLTATPRKIDVRHKDPQGDFRVVSMDNPAVYGKVAHNLPFAEAVRQGIICDYRVVVATVDSNEVPAAALQRGITLVKGDPHATRWVAMQIAVAKAVTETEARKVITFHTRVQQARHFASDSPRGIRQFLPEFAAGHVEGADPVATRKETLAKFSGNGKTLVANARCLTEGVDIPAVDMVVFSSPRKSKVDIIQAIGRAMRKPSGGAKEFGYVVVPILLAPHTANDVESACRKTDWEDIVDVLAALRDHDARLEEHIRDQQVAMGGGRVFDPKAFSEHLQIIGPAISLETLQRHISAVITARLGESWDLRFGQMQAFKAKEGHCNVPQRKPYTALGHWASDQRTRWRAGKLSPDRVKRLESLGFVWELEAERWKANYEALVAFKRKKGHCNVPSDFPEEPALGHWLGNQRAFKAKGKLAADRIRLLEAVGITWNTVEAQWEEKFKRLVTFQKREGHANVPGQYAADVELANWVNNQRAFKRRGRLTPERIERLEAIGFCWDAKDSIWGERFRELEAFARSAGHCNVPVTFHNRQLALWVVGQRSSFKGGKLSQERIAKLESLGFVWDPFAVAWEQKCRELRAFRAKHGHSNVPQVCADYPGLGVWLNKQRQKKKKGKLEAAREEMLVSLAVEWKPKKGPPSTAS
jgi:superfamily II DNA or RNA helicase